MSSHLPDRGQDRRRQSIPLRDMLAGTGSGRQADGAPFANTDNISTSWYCSPSNPNDGGNPESPIHPTALQSALPPELRQSTARDKHHESAPVNTFYRASSLFAEESSHRDYAESDRVPLTAGAQPMSGALGVELEGFRKSDSFQTVSDMDTGISGDHAAKSLGHGLESAAGSTRLRSYGMSLNPNEYQISRSPSAAGALQRAGSIVRAMSQRVVNITGESEVMNQRASRHETRSPRISESDRDRNPVLSVLGNASYTPQAQQPAMEKSAGVSQFDQLVLPSGSRPSPLKGRTLGIFSPQSRVRLFLCDALVNPYTEPVILLLIVLQTILLVVESAPNVFTVGNGRPEKWGTKVIDWILLGLFIIFTLELVARIIVSGFVLNAPEYSTIDRKKGIRAAITDQYRAIFQPGPGESVKGGRPAFTAQSALARSFSTILPGQQELPDTLEEQQRFQLARRAFLRHSFNRLDFVAVLSYWIAFALGITGLEHRHHVYVFRMLSCLRILRLLAITNGTAIILRSLKKAAPLLVRVGFLIGFFWLLFAIIGLQSFKSSLSRQCVWLDPLRPMDLSASYTNEMQFCGGYLDNFTGSTMPWMKFGTPGSLDGLINGTSDGKGFICPRGSICLEQKSPFNNTVNFDNIFHSLELVFVIMSANTFTDLMYYTMGSDYVLAALFFAAGIMIMLLWLTNLLIAVITSSFQVIREESKSSAFTADPEPFVQDIPEARSRNPSKLQQLYDKTSILWVFVITFGLLCQAFRSARMSQSRETFINMAEVTVTIALDIEIIIRIAANWHGFHRSWRNIFDLFLALVTTIILIPPIRYSPSYPWLTVFQIVRVYRVVLAIPVTRKLILLVLGNAAGIANLMLFVFLMTLLVAIFAAQLFRGEIPVHDDSGKLKRTSFFTIYNSFLGMYQILSSENWTDILYTVTSYTVTLNTAWIGSVFLIGWFILSFFILVNMFIAVIQENFDVSEDEKRLEQVKTFLQRKELGHTSSNLALSTIFSLGRSRRKKDPLDYGPAMMEMLLKDAVVRDFLDDDSTGPIQYHGGKRVIPPRSATALFGADVKPGFLSRISGKFVHRKREEPNPFYSNIRFDGPTDTLDPRQMARQAVSATSARRKAQREYLARHPRYNHSLYIFPPTDPIRRLCQRLVGPARGIERFDGVEPNKFAWYAFSAFVYAVVVAMVILACVVTPLYQKEYKEGHPDNLYNWYVWTDLAFALVFTIEAGIKAIADGLIWTPNAYLRSSWGIMDGVVLVTLWINVITLLVNDGAISRALGAFKALRALRLLNVSDSAMDTFHSLIIAGWWKLLGAAFISLSLLIPFAIYGLNLFNGLMVLCNDSNNMTSLNGCFGEYGSSPFSADWPMLAPRVASNPYFNFDDFGSSLFTLFQIVSQEGWIDVSFAAQAIVGRGQQPQDLAAQGNALFFVAFNLLATVFILTLFISVFMRNYTEQTGVAYLTAEQRAWLELRKLLRHISPSKSSYNVSEKGWKKWCHKRAIEKRGIWYQSVTVVLVLHLLLLVAEFSSEPMWWTRTREVVFLLFILVYLANIAIRISGLGWTRFRRSSWDVYSLVTVCGAFITTVALLIADTRADTYVQLHKFFLVAIVLLVIPRNDALDQLFKTAAASLPVIGNLLATWLVLFLVFAIALTQAFSLTRFGGNETNNLNFRSVPKALILLFRMSLGEGWNQIMEDYAGIEPPMCVDEAIFFYSDCGSKPWARFLFVAWNILSMYIFVNLFVSLIYESFSYVYQRSSGTSAVDRDEIRRFKEAWRSVDPAGTGFITKEAFPRLLGELSGVFQMRIYQPEDSVRQILEDVRNDRRSSRHLSVSTASGAGEVDLDKLNRRLALLDVKKIQEQRRRFKVFFGEVLVSADPDKGIAFTDVLMILAHYNIINDNKSLKLEEFLRRRARLQRVDEEIRRKVVQGFFDTLYWSRQFKRHMEAKRASQSVADPRLSIPEILINEDGNEDGRFDGSRSFKPDEGSVARWTHLGVGEGGAGEGGAGPGPTTSLSTDVAHAAGSSDHPLSSPPSSGPALSSRQETKLGFSFELYEPEDQGSSSRQDSSRTEAIVGPTQAGDLLLGDSVWVSTQDDATLPKSEGGTHHHRDPV